MAKIETGTALQGLAEQVLKLQAEVKVFVHLAKEESFPPVRAYFAKKAEVAKGRLRRALVEQGQVRREHRANCRERELNPILQRQYKV